MAPLRLTWLSANNGLTAILYLIRVTTALKTLGVASMVIMLVCNTPKSPHTTRSRTGSKDIPSCNLTR